jgi:hypothetical protein
MSSAVDSSIALATPRFTAPLTADGPGDTTLDSHADTPTAGFAAVEPRGGRSGRSGPPDPGCRSPPWREHDRQRSRSLSKSKT